MTNIDVIQRCSENHKKTWIELFGLKQCIDMDVLHTHWIEQMVEEAIFTFQKPQTNKNL